MRGKNKLLYWTALLLLVGGVVAYAQHRALPKRYQDYQDSEERGRRMASRLEEFKAQKDRLFEQVQALDSHPLELEAAIRRDKGLVREGETVYRIQYKPESEPGMQEANPGVFRGSE